MADPITLQQAQDPNWAYNHALQGYLSGQFMAPASSFYNTAGVTGANLAARAGALPGIIGYSSLTNMLANQGRVDPRLLASAQAQNTRSTQQQQTAARGNAAASGFGNSGLAAALQAAIGSAGANRSANLNYQDIADSYARQQQNLGLLKSLVLEPQRDYAAIGAGQYGTDKAAQTQQQGATLSAIGSILAAIFCKVAAELYGPESDKFHDARAYVMNRMPAEISVKYAVHGQELADAAKTDPDLRKRLLPIFDEFSRRGKALKGA